MSEQNTGSFKRFITAHKGVLTGSLIGLVVGALILWIGFFSTLFLALCIGIGAFFGSNSKLKKKIISALDKILPDIFK